MFPLDSLAVSRTEWAKAHFSFVFQNGPMPDLEKIRQLAERVAASHQMEVVDLEYVGPGKRPVLRIFIEKSAPERARLNEAKLHVEESAENADLALDRLAWITHEDCEAFSRDFGTVIEVEDLAPDHEYVLEVSSPGLDRKLHGVEDYRRFAGSLVKIETVEPVAGNRHWRGRLTEVRADSVRLDTSSGEKRKRSRRKREARAGQDPEQATVEIALANIAKANLVPEL